MLLTPGARQLGPVRMVDALIALGLFLLGLLYTLPAAEVTDAGFRMRDAAGIVLLAAQTLPLAWRHTAPRMVLVVVLATWLIDRGLNYESSFATLGLVVAFHGVAAYSSRRQAFAWGGTAAAIAVGWTGIGALVTDEVGILEFTTMFLWVGVPFAIGRGDAYAREKWTALEVSQERLIQDQAAAAESAVRTERARIARELHDVVAHEITVMTLQAEGARRALGDSDRRVTEALQTISDSGRKGLAEMHRMIGVLRDTSEGEESVPHVGEAYTPSRVEILSPMPSLAALPALTKQVKDAGLPVTLHVKGNAHVPAGVELSAYRIVQEALTNAMKHAGAGARATVVIERAHNAVTVTVEDDGRGLISEASTSNGGHGLAGMRERVLSLAGSIDYGPRPGGGFRVRAVLPSHDDTIAPSSPRKRAPRSALLEAAEKERGS